jgi:DNA-binding response OmpR family regulator
MAKILFIDDDTNTLELMEKISQILGHQAITCPQADLAVQYALQVNPDLIMVDINMQEFNGFDVVRQLRQNVTQSETPILILSASDPDEDTNQALKAGASGYLPKPLTIDGLNQVLEKYNHIHSH